MNQIGNLIAVTDAKIVRIFLDFKKVYDQCEMTIYRSKNLFLYFAG